MRLSNLLIAGSNALYVIAAPTDFELNSPLALPVPGSSTYDADLAAAVAYARSHVSSSVQTSTIEPVKQRLCGWYIPKPKGRDKPMYKTGLLLCMETEPGDEMTRMINRYCGFCAVFDEHQCFGNILWNGGPATPPMELPSDKTHAVPGGKSYFCF